ncbi:MAG TPA: DUF1345 domain-containing protein [Stellaceae bacterium]|nr:DUF1345 domain-containing protein [Stellaceae bacterium]
MNARRSPTGFGFRAALRRPFPATRLALATAAGLAVYLALPAAWLRSGERLALSWLAGIAVFLALVALVVVHASPEQVRRRARELDPRGWMITVILVAAATVSLFALGFTLEKPPNERAIAMATRLVLAGLTVVASWTLVHTTFALHYTHHYYGDRPAGAPQDRGGLAFPGEEQPDYWDFLYFSFVIGMTCQVSDVQVTSRPMRRLTLMHGVLSFFFNTVILALAVNLLASSL